MRIDLNPRSIFNINTSCLGELAVFPPTYELYRLLSKKFNREIAKINPMDFVRQLILASSCPANLAIDGSKPKEFKYPNDAFSKLTDDDVERFSELYVKHAVDLVKISSVGNEKDRNDNKRDGILAELTKKPDENYSAYLHRVKSFEHRKMHESMLGIASGADLAMIAVQNGIGELSTFSLVAEDVRNRQRSLETLGVSLPSAFTKSIDMYGATATFMKCSAIADYERSFARVADILPHQSTLIGIDNEQLGIPASIQKFANTLGVSTAGQLGFASGMPEYVSDAIAQSAQRIQNFEDMAVNHFDKFVTSFKVPLATELACLDRQANLYAASSVLRNYMPTSETLAGLVASIKEPWLSMTDPAKSVQGLVGLTAIGQALVSQETFSPRFTDALRGAFGDWRDAACLPDQYIDDPVSRLSFYKSLGFDQALTYFPDLSYEHILDEVGIIQPVILPEIQRTRVQIQKAKVNDSMEVDATFSIGPGSRTDTAIIIMRKFETSLREFIVNKMSERFGTKWLKQKISGEMRKKWEERMSEAAKSGVGCECHLIHFSDLGDLCAIIVQKDNWENLFSDYFCRKEFVIESFARISPVRRCLAHFRELSNEDIIFFRVETMRILKLIQKK